MLVDYTFSEHLLQYLFEHQQVKVASRTHTKCQLEPLAALDLQDIWDRGLHSTQATSSSIDVLWIDMKCITCLYLFQTQRCIFYKSMWINYLSAASYRHGRSAKHFILYTSSGTKEKRKGANTVTSATSFCVPKEEWGDIPTKWLRNCTPGIQQRLQSLDQAHELGKWWLIALYRAFCMTDPHGSTGGSSRMRICIILNIQSPRNKHGILT